jgi:hypothetical protein
VTQRGAEGKVAHRKEVRDKINTFSIYLYKKAKQLDQLLSAEMTPATVLGRVAERDA